LLIDDEKLEGHQLLLMLKKFEIIKVKKCDCKLMQAYCIEKNEWKLILNELYIDELDLMIMLGISKIELAEVEKNQNIFMMNRELIMLN